MKKILIIEDDQSLRKQMAQILRFEGFDTVEAADGKAGVSCAMGSNPDLVICDIMMPALDGFGVLQALRNNPRTTLTPFIFLTALVEIHDRRQGMTEGADDYITKPYDPDALVGSVRRRLEKRDRQIEESRMRAEEVSLAVAASLPQEILQTVEHITTVVNLLTVKCAPQDAQVSEMRLAVARESDRLRRAIRRLHLYSQLPQLYANRFEIVKGEKQSAPESVVERVAMEVCRNWNRESDLVVKSESAQLPLAEDYLALLVEELVDNACKFSAPESPIHVHGEARPEFWVLSVSNHGAALSPDQIAQMGAFKQFWTGNKKPPGLGLGLALTQGVARLHGCEFEIQSSAGLTTAAVMIPFQPRS